MPADRTPKRAGRGRAVDDVVGTIVGCLVFVPLALAGMLTMLGGPVDLSGDNGTVGQILIGGAQFLIGAGTTLMMIVALITNERVFSSPAPPSDWETDEHMIPWAD